MCNGSGFRHGGDRCHHCGGRGREKWVAVSDYNTVTVGSDLPSHLMMNTIVVAAAVTVTDRDPPCAARAMENNSFWSTSTSPWNGNMTNGQKHARERQKCRFRPGNPESFVFPGPTTPTTTWWSSQADSRWTTSAKCPARRFTETLSTWWAFFTSQHVYCDCFSMNLAQSFDFLPLKWLQRV